MLSKSTLRAQMIAQRQNIEGSLRQEAAKKAAEIFSTTQAFVSCQHIAVYFANTHELGCQFLIEKIWQTGKDCYLPVIDVSQKILTFAKYTAKTILCKNRYGIFEPQAPLFIPTDQLDIVIVPLVAFDAAGYRLGMGSGYYDRTFSMNSHPPLIGLAYECQYIAHLPKDPWDIPLHAILTEERLYYF